MPQAGSMQAPKRAQLVAQFGNRNDTLTKDARLVNCFAEKDPNSEDIWVEKRPGLALSEFFGGLGQGAYNWLGDVYAVYGGVLYKNAVSLGAVDATNGVYRFEQVRGNPAKLILGNAVATYWTDGTALNQLNVYNPLFGGNFTTGASYVIASIGTTDFTAIGAASNTIGLTFVATGPGSGTGSARLVAGGFTVGVTYRIAFVGTTNFIALGAAANTVGTVFTSTGVGAGTGYVDSPTFFPQALRKGFAYLDGTLYVTDGQANIWGTKTFDDPTLWDPLNKIVARVEPDLSVGIGKQLVYVIEFKQWTTEVFYDAENTTGSPLLPVQGAKAPYGCVNMDSVQSINDQLFWLTANRTSSPQIAMMDNLHVNIISTPAIDRLLRTTRNTPIHSCVFQLAGHSFYILTLVNLDITLVYDITVGMWYQWTDPDGTSWGYVASTFDALGNHIMQHPTNGSMYLLDSDFIYPNDFGNEITVDIYSPNFTGGVDRRKVLNQMRFNCDQDSAGELLVRVSDDDYQHWSNFRAVDLGIARPTLDHCGTFYRRAWNIRHQSNTPLRIKTVDLQLDIGTL